MARGGRREGSGRKPTGKSKSAKVAMLVRVKPEVRARLERDAKRSKISLSRQVELQLDAVRASPRADSQTQALCFLIAQISKVGQQFERPDDAPVFSWRDNPFDFTAFKFAVMHLLDRLAPSGAIEEKSRYPLAQTPDEMGRVMALTVLVSVENSAALRSMDKEGRGEMMENLSYAFPQAARDLGLLRMGEKR